MHASKRMIPIGLAILLPARIVVRKPSSAYDGSVLTDNHDVRRSDVTGIPVALALWRRRR